MSPYIFLDNWVLSGYTKGDDANYLSAFIRSNDLTILVDSTSLLELYNPNWSKAPSIDRTRTASQFLADHSCAIVDSQELIFAEIRAYPNNLSQIPIGLQLDNIEWSTRSEALLMFLRRDPLFVELDKDIGRWVQTYEATKNRWLSNVQAIIDDATKAGILVKLPDGKFDPTASNKDRFLQYLDHRYLGFRHHSGLALEVQKNLTQHMPALFHGATAQLPGVRFTSLCFWYAYIETDKSFPAKQQGSDFGDLYRMALVPYCSYFTADKTMERLLQRVLTEMPQGCKILNQTLLTSTLDKYSHGSGIIPRY